MNKLNFYFSENLKRNRKKLNLTQKQFSFSIGYSEKAISKWESGISIPPLSALVLIADKLKISLDELVGYKEKAEYFLGIDGGATKTLFLLVNSQGKIVKKLILQSCNPVDIGFENACEILNRGITEICQKIPYRFISLSAGISGGGIEENKNRFYEFFSKFNFYKVINGNDLIGLMEENLKGKNGIVIISGTGSSAIVKYNQILKRVGGYGYMFAEGGDGYSIGRDIINACLKFEDGYGENTLLYNLLKNELKTENIFESISSIYKMGKRKVASFAPLAFVAFEKNDKIAKDIITKNCKCISELIDASIKIYSAMDCEGEKDKKIDIYFAGGIMNKKDIIIPIVKKFCNYKNYNFNVANTPAVYGNIKLAGYDGEIYE